MTMISYKINKQDRHFFKGGIRNDGQKYAFKTFKKRNQGNNRTISEYYNTLMTTY